MADAYERYLAHKHGSGVTANLNTDGSHKTVNTVLDAYSKSGKTVPADVAQAAEELRGIASTEFNMRGSTKGERMALARSGAYNAYDMGSRERELIQVMNDRSRDVLNEKGRLEIEMAREGVRQEQSNTRVLEGAEGLKIETSRLGLQRLRNQEELEALTMRQTRSAAEADAKVQSAAQHTGNTSVRDMMQVIDSENPQMIAEVFGEGVDRTTALAVLSQRLNSETVVNKQEAEYNAGVSLQNAEAILEEHGISGIEAFISGEQPLPEGLQRSQLHAGLQLGRERYAASQNFDMQVQANEITSNQQKATLLAHKIEASSMTDIAAMNDAITTTGQLDIEVAPGKVVSYTPEQFKASVASREQQLITQAQTNIVKQTELKHIEARQKELAGIEKLTDSALGYVPHEVKQELELKQNEIMSLVAQGDMAGARKVSDKLRDNYEQILTEEGHDAKTVEAIMSGRFVDEAQVGDKFANFLGQAPEEGRFSPVGNAVLSQFQNAGEITPANLSKFRQALQNPDYEGDPFAEIGLSMGQVANTARDTYMSAKVGSAFNAVFADERVAAALGPQGVEDFKELIAEHGGEGRAPITLEKALMVLQTIGDGNSEQGLGQGELINIFHDALKNTDASGLLQLSKGGVSFDEAAMSSVLVNAMSGGNIKAFGAGSARITEAPFVLGEMLDDRIDNEVLAHQNLGLSLGADAIQSAILGAYKKGGGVTAFIEDAGVTPRELLDTKLSLETFVRANPALSSIVTREVARQQLANSLKKETWTEWLFGTQGPNGIYGDIDFDAINKAVEDAGIQPAKQ